MNERGKTNFAPSRNSSLRHRSAWVMLAATAIAVFFCLPLTARGQSSEQELHQRVDKIFRTWNKPDSPGCVIGVIKDGKFVYQKSFGAANLEHDVPLKPESVFRIASTSKQFTAACILLLAEQGKLSLTDDIRKFFPEMPDYGAKIEVHHLVHHTSGLRDYLGLFSWAGMGDSHYYTDADVLKMLWRQKQLNFLPGEQCDYSNSGYFLLGQIVRRVSGKSLRRFADQHIFKPLEMNHTHFHDNHNRIVKNRASGYQRGIGGLEISMTTLDLVGDGGVFTTVEDLRRWDQNFYHNRLAVKNFRQKMLTCGVLNSGEPAELADEQYAFGLLVGRYKGLPTVRHGGAFAGFRAELVRFPEEKLSVVCLCNLGNMNPSALCDRVADVFLADQIAQHQAESESSETAQSSEASSRPQRKKNDPKVVESLRESGIVGSYYSPELDAKCHLAIEKGRVVVRIANAKRKQRLVATSREEMNVMQMIFVRPTFDEKGQVVGLTLDSPALNGIIYNKTD